MAYGVFKYLTRRTASDKIIRDNAFNIAKNPKYGGCQRRLASMVYKFFDEKTSGGTVKNEDICDVISDLKGEEIVRKGDELYVKWKGYNNLLNS